MFVLQTCCTHARVGSCNMTMRARLRAGEELRWQVQHDLTLKSHDTQNMLWLGMFAVVKEIAVRHREN